MVGKMYDAVRKTGQYTSEISYPTHVFYVAYVLTRFMKGAWRFRRIEKRMVIYGKYVLIRPLLLVWKKCDLVGFPKDLIRLISEYLTWKI